MNPSFYVDKIRFIYYIFHTLLFHIFNFSASNFSDDILKFYKKFTIGFVKGHRHILSCEGKRILNFTKIYISLDVHKTNHNYI